jgi:hypothetical protein
MQNLESEYKEVKKALRITDAEVAEMFGYSTTASFRNAARKKKIMEGVVALYNKTLEAWTLPSSS